MKNHHKKVLYRGGERMGQTAQYRNREDIWERLNRFFFDSYFFGIRSLIYSVILLCVLIVNYIRVYKHGLTTIYILYFKKMHIISFIFLIVLSIAFLFVIINSLYLMITVPPECVYMIRGIRIILSLIPGWIIMLKPGALYSRWYDGKIYYFFGIYVLLSLTVLVYAIWVYRTGVKQLREDIDLGCFREIKK